MEMVAFFAFLGALLLVPLVLRHRTQTATLRLIGETMGKGQTLDPALVGQLMAAPKSNLARQFAFLCLFLGPAPLVIGLGLGAAVLSFGEQFIPGDQYSQWLLASVLAAGAGLGYTIVGIAILRLFGREKDA